MSFDLQPTPPTFTRARPSDIPPTGDSRWLLFNEAGVLMRGVDIPSTADLAGLGPKDPTYLGHVDDMAYFADNLPDNVEVPQGLSMSGLRSLLGSVDDLTWGIASYASQMMYWRKTGRFCPVCATPTEARTQDWGRTCPNCGHVGYPRVSPAVLILIHDGDRLLLASKPGWDRYSILAGFVDSAETLEECVRRETFEEVKVTVTDIEYAGSQSWPFPHQLMIGFTCRYVVGDITVDNEELDRAGWFTRDALPPLPPSISLSRQLIDAWIDRRFSPKP